mmetsp:Transcript_1741/g.6123  ORF Transcript_1741/g.6123 Transcript_1741/m.6123 type:complete len:695 (-) Transcript_1741:3580-5664(-)
MQSMLPSSSTKRRILVIFMAWILILTVGVFLYLTYFPSHDPYVFADNMRKQDSNDYGNKREDVVGDVLRPVQSGNIVYVPNDGNEPSDDASTYHSEYLDHESESEQHDDSNSASEEPAPTLMDLKRLKTNQIMIIGSNTFLGYQITHHFRRSTFDYDLFATFDTQTNQNDNFRLLRRNALRELIPGKALERMDKVNVCSDFEKIKDQVGKFKYLVYAEDTTECLETLLKAMTSDHVLVLLRPWTEAYKNVGEGKVQLELSEDEATSALSSANTPEYKGKVIELIHSDVVGFLSTPLHSEEHVWSESLTKNETLVYYTSKRHGVVKRDRLHRQDFANAIHLVFQSVEEGRFRDTQHELINVASGKSIANVKVLAALQHALNLQPTNFETREYESSLPLRVRFNLNKAKSLLHFGARVVNPRVLMREYSDWFTQFYFPQTFSMSTYLTAQGDPQRNFKYSCEFNKMEEFYDSVHIVALTNPFVVFVFHDGCPDTMVQEFETPYVRFEKFNPKTYQRESPNDERFYMFRQFLLDRRAMAPSPQYYPTHTLWTDLFDVWINKNPFDFMRNYEAEKKKLGEDQEYYLYPGQDNPRDTLGSNGWMKGRVSACSWNKEIGEYADAPFLNAGVCGGEYESMIRLVTLIGDELSTRKSHINCNMPAYNYVLNKYFGGQYRTGPPFTSPFWEKSRAPEYFICHK